jgi:S-adenosylmethionine decarboxylase
MILDQTLIEPKGKHLIIDLHHAHSLDDMTLMKSVIKAIVLKTQTTLIFENFHHFHPSGITGIACLAESHISVHTWPEHNFAAFDVFMCGEAQPELAIPILKQHFGGTESITLLNRGLSLPHL